MTKDSAPTCPMCGDQQSITTDGSSFRCYACDCLWGVLDAPKHEPPYVYAHDLRNVVSLIDWIERHDPDGDIVIESGSKLVLGSKNEYPIGVIEFEEDQWRFTPHDDRHADADS